MDFFNALYFNFVTLTTIGLGDFVPKRFALRFTGKVRILVLIIYILPWFILD